MARSQFSRARVSAIELALTLRELRTPRGADTPALIADAHQAGYDAAVRAAARALELDDITTDAFCRAAGTTNIRQE